MIYFVLILALFFFITALHLLKIVPKAGEAVAVSRKVLSVLKSDRHSDQEKEAASRAAAKKLFGTFLSILLRGAVAFAAPALLVLAGSFAGLYSGGEAMTAATNGYFITGSTIVMLPAIFILR